MRTKNPEIISKTIQDKIKITNQDIRIIKINTTTMIMDLIKTKISIKIKDHKADSTKKILKTNKTLINKEISNKIILLINNNQDIKIKEISKIIIKDFTNHTINNKEDINNNITKTINKILIKNNNFTKTLILKNPTYWMIQTQIKTPNKEISKNPTISKDNKDNLTKRVKVEEAATTTTEVMMIEASKKNFKNKI